MSASDTLRARLKAVVVTSLILILLGTGAAAAYWTAPARVDGTAGAATVGLEQSADVSSLSTTYSAENLTATGSVEITNTGNREAAYALTVRAETTTHAGLPAALAVSTRSVDSTLDCLPSADAVDGSSLPHALEGTISAGQTLVLCVSTSLTEQEVTEFGGQELELSITSTLTYAQGEAWTVSAPAQRAAQSVEDVPIDAGFGTEIFCSDPGSTPHYLRLEFPQNHGYQSETSYRMFLAPEATPQERVLYEPEQETHGWNTAVSFMKEDPKLHEYVNAPGGGWGNTWLFVEQQVDGSDEWTPTAYAKVRFVELPWGHEGVGIECGWQG